MQRLHYIKRWQRLAAQLQGPGLPGRALRALEGLQLPAQPERPRRALIRQLRRTPQLLTLAGSQRLKRVALHRLWLQDEAERFLHVLPLGPLGRGLDIETAYCIGARVSSAANRAWAARSFVSKGLIAPAQAKESAPFVVAALARMDEAAKDDERLSRYFAVFADDEGPEVSGPEPPAK